MRVIGFAGWSGSGKTTLLTRVLPVLVGKGLRVSTIKHAHHDFDVDKPGKDSHAHRMAGAMEVLVSSSRRWALVHELRDEAEPLLEELVAHLQPADLLLIEGFKRAKHPKVEVHRMAVGLPLLQPEDPHIVGVISDAPLALNVPVLSINDVDAVADFIQTHAIPLSDVGHGPTD